MKINQVLENVDYKTYRFTDIEKGILLLIKVSPTPTTAYEYTMGEFSFKAARDKLKRLEYINVFEGKANLTPMGEEALENESLYYNNEITKYGEEILKYMDSRSTESLGFIETDYQ